MGTTQEEERYGRQALKGTPPHLPARIPAGPAIDLARPVMPPGAQLEHFQFETLCVSHHARGKNALSPPTLGRTALCRRLVFCLLQWPPYRAATKKMPFRTSGVSFEKSALGEGRGVWGEGDPLPR